MESIRYQLTVLLLLGTGILCGLGGLSSAYIARRAILREFDYSLRTKVHDFYSLTEHEEGGLEFELSDKMMPEFERTNHPEFYQISLPDGEVLAVSPSMRNSRLPLPEIALSDVPHLYDLTLPNGLPGRAAVMMAIPFRSNNRGDFTDEAAIIATARDTVHLKQTVSIIMISHLAGTLLILAVMGLSIRWVVAKELHPLDALARQAEAIQPEKLDIRFPHESMPTELQPIVDQLNLLLERIEQAFQRERYLSTGMAHELYTPIAELRSMAEAALRWPDDREATDSLASHVQAISLHMQDMVEALLSLARCQAGLQKNHPEPVDLQNLLEDMRNLVTDRLKTRPIALEWEIDQIYCIKTDRAMLATILRNLFLNAAEHAPEGGRVRCSLKSADTGLALELANTNPGLLEEDLPHLLEPLWRKDPSRTDSDHCGLGLALADQFAKVLGMQLTVALQKSDWLVITLWMPHAKGTA